MDWFRLTPESIAALAQVILAAIIAVYLFTRKGKSTVLWLLAISLIGETTHHLIKLIAFSVPALYQSATPLLGVSSVLIYVVLLVFAYEYRDRLFSYRRARCADDYDHIRGSAGRLSAFRIRNGPAARSNTRISNDAVRVDCVSPAHGRLGNCGITAQSQHLP